MQRGETRLKLASASCEPAAREGLRPYCLPMAGNAAPCSFPNYTPSA